MCGQDQQDDGGSGPRQRECSIQQRSMAHREPFLGPSWVSAENFSLYCNTAWADLWGNGSKRRLWAGCIPAGRGGKQENLGEWVGRVPLPEVGRQAGHSGGHEALSTSHVQRPAIVLGKSKGLAWLLPLSE